MESLCSMFSSVPTEALVRVLELCGQSVAVASAWLLENDWRDLMDEEERNCFAAPRSSVMPSVSSLIATTNEVALASTSGFQHNRTMVVSTEVHDVENNRQESHIHYTRRGMLDYQVYIEESSDSEDSEDEEEDEEEENDDSYDDKGVMGVPPLTKRMKMTKSRETESQAKADDFWAAFDGQVVVKSMIELLNTTLSKLAHSKVVLLNQPAMKLDQAAAMKKLKSVLAFASEDTIDTGCKVTSGQLQLPRHASNRMTVASLLNGDSPTAGKKARSAQSSNSPTIAMPKTPISQKRKRNETAEATKAEDSFCQGFFAYFFPVRELDMMWRTVMHTHLFKKSFGEKIEFQTASGGPFRKEDFDELMHLQNSASSSRASSVGFSRLSMLKCCLIFPCPADEDEMFRVGRNIHSILKVQGGLYYQVLDIPPSVCAVSLRGSHDELMNEAGKITEAQFRQFARYRIVEKEQIATETTKVGAESCMSYQEPRKKKYSLEILDASKWSSRLDD
ncbi:unnamed protein product [Peronospora destructor]|uniref:CUE domain-containing protein n=1 Tax=Peronospora destructor TaxID=86335 RepID=A0AAV0VE19_9STRA|nr:unnamed protein product [Peronospora destructor]